MPSNLPAISTISVTMNALGQIIGSGAYIFNIASIPSGASAVTVSGLNLAAIPRGIHSSVCSPNSSGLLLYSSVDKSTITTSGFMANLNGNTDTTGYVLAYNIIL